MLRQESKHGGQLIPGVRIDHIQTIIGMSGYPSAGINQIGRRPRIPHQQHCRGIDVRAAKLPDIPVQLPDIISIKIVGFTVIIVWIAASARQFIQQHIHHAVVHS